MSGGPSWAITEPSLYSTIEWTIGLGVDHHGNLLGRKLEEPPGLDDFQGLVHQRSPNRPLSSAPSPTSDVPGPPQRQPGRAVPKSECEMGPHWR